MKEKLLNAKDRIISEIWNAITHGIGVVLGVVFLVMLILRSIDEKNLTALVAYCIYGACFILMFLMSTLYHAIQHKKAKSVLRIFDHISIYYFIAGSFTPPILLLTDGWQRIFFLVLMWALAILGTIYKVTIKNKMDKYKGLSTVLYIAMGWMAVFLINPVIHHRYWQFGVLMLIGGLLYTFGTLFYKSYKLKYNHVIWHLFVLSAAVVHFRAFYKYL
ncbi:MAG: hemolysin III family protein [Christensenellaceae bacterium]|nr:hemolysin III family protein [Christensenellaceae bacterium]